MEVHWSACCPSDTNWAALFPIFSPYLDAVEPCRFCRDFRSSLEKRPGQNFSRPTALWDFVSRFIAIGRFVLPVTSDSPPWELCSRLRSSRRTCAMQRHTFGTFVLRTRVGSLICTNPQYEVLIFLRLLTPLTRSCVNGPLELYGCMAEPLTDAFFGNFVVVPLPGSRQAVCGAEFWWRDSLCWAQGLIFDLSFRNHFDWYLSSIDSSSGLVCVWVFAIISHDVPFDFAHRPAVIVRALLFMWFQIASPKITFDTMCLTVFDIIWKDPEEV